MRRRLAALMLVAVALLLSGCLRTLHRDATAEAIALAPRDALDLPVRQSRPYWLLRSQPGWIGAHEVSFGGAPGDAAVAVVRAALFEDERAAGYAFTQLTPHYIHLLLRDRVKEQPPPFEMLPSSEGDELAVSHYEVPLATDAEEDMVVAVDMLIARAGRTVLFLESLGLSLDQQISTMDQLSRAAYRLTREVR